MSEMPYIGLRPFNEDEADIFFGRDDQANELLAKIGQQHFIAVIGLSGCGKSSLIRAGVIPKIQMGFLPQAGVYWRTITLCPGTEPFANLAYALLNEHEDRGIKKEYETWLQNAGIDVDRAKNCLYGNLRNSSNLQETLNGLNIPEKTNFLLIVDQFEEISRFKEHATEEVENFVRFLLNSSPVKSRVYVLITMRAEYLGECAKFYDLAEKINSGLFLVPRLTPEQLREAIENPIMVYSGSIDNQLVENILNDANNEPDQLPLMQHLLMGMWDKTRYHNFVETHNSDEPSKFGVHIDETWYLEWGAGVKKSLSRHLDKFYNNLTNSKKQLVAEYLFRNLVEVRENFPSARRAAKVSDLVLALLSWQKLTQQLDSYEITESSIFKLLESVIEEFRRDGRRFLEPRVETESKLSRETLINVAHESVIRQWGKLQEWKKTEQDYANLYLSLEQDCERWEKSQKDDDLLKGSKLAQATEWLGKEQPTAIWAKRYSQKEGDFFRKILGFIEESEAQRLKIINREKALAQLETAKFRNQLRLRQGITLLSIGFAGVVFIGALVTYGLYDQLLTLQGQRILDVFNSRVSQAISQIGNLQFIDAKTTLTTNDSFAKDEKNKSSIPSSRQQINQLLLQYGHLLSQTAPKNFPDFQAEIHSIIPVDDGFVLGGKGGKWGYFDQEHKFNWYPKLEGDVSAIAFYEPFRWLITGDSRGQITVWDQKTLRPIPQPSQQLDKEVTALAVVDNHLMAGDSAGQLHHWQITPQGLEQHRVEEIHPNVKGEKDKIRISRGGFALNSSKTQLLTAAYEPNAKLWELKNGTLQLKSTLEREEMGKVYQAIFSNSDKAFVTALDNFGARLREVSGKRLQSFFGHRQAVFSVQFSHQDRYLITGSQDNQIRIWDIESGKTLQILEGHEGTVTNLLRKDNQLWSVGLDGALKQWSLDLPYQLVETCVNKECPENFDVTSLGKLDYRKNPISLSISPSGHHLVVGFFDGSLRLYGFPQLNLLDEISAHQDRIRHINFNEQGTLFATASYDGSVGIWKITDGKIQNKLPNEQKISVNDKVYDVAFSPDAKTVATASLTDGIKLYSLGDLKQQPKELLKGEAFFVKFRDIAEAL